MKHLKIIAAMAAFSVCIPASSLASDANDETLVREAISNYVNAFYKTDPELAKKSVWDKVAKHGYWHTKAGEAYSGPHFMSYEQLLKVAANVYAEHPPKADAPQVITVFEVNDKTASAKLEADWGVDYIHLTNFDGHWKIVNVLWQAYPEPPIDDEAAHSED